MQDSTELPSSPSHLTKQNEPTLTLQPSDSKSSVNSNSTEYDGSICSINILTKDNTVSMYIQLDTEESDSSTKHYTTPSNSFTPVFAGNEFNQVVRHTTFNKPISIVGNATKHNIAPRLEDASPNDDVVPERSSQTTHWFALNCLPSLKNAAIYLIACGAATMITGISLASAPIAIVGGAMAGLGLLLGLYGTFNRHDQKSRLKIGHEFDYDDGLSLDGNEWFEFENTNR